MDTETKNRLALASIGLAVCICATAPAWGDQENAATSGGTTAGLEEIVVTARRASESLQTTPVAVTALSHDMLVQQQVVDVADLQHVAPDVTIGGAGTGPSSLVYLAIRGEAQNSPNSASDNSVGIYVDGVYIARPIIGNLGLIDESQVEVLRGPQGTLFGRNTTGGALVIATNRPTNDFDGYVKLGYGNFSDKLGEIMLNGPLTDELAGRIAFRFNDHNAYYPNPSTGYDQGKLNHEYDGRASLRWTPSSIPLTVDAAFDYTEEQDTGQATALMGFNSTYAPFPIPLNLGQLVALTGNPNPNNYLAWVNDNYRRSYAGPVTTEPLQNTPFNSNHATGVNVNTDLVVAPDTHLKSITAYRQSYTANAEDLDGTPVQIGSFLSEYRQHQFSEEVQLSGKVDKFDWIGGAYFFQEGGTELSDSNTFGFLAPIFGPAVAAVNENLADFDARSYAAFAQTNYHITDTVRATVGYRYTWDTRDLDRHGRNDIMGANTCAVGATAGLAPALSATLPCNDPHSASFSYPAYTAGVDWQVSDQLFLYVKTSRASMAGGFNTRPVPGTVSNSFNPEENKDVEVGAKSDLFDRHLRINLALFHAWQYDVQRIVNAIVNNATTQYVANSGNSTTYGAELEITAIPYEGLEVTAAGAYLHAAYVAGTFHELQVVNGVTETVDRSGEPVPQAPKYTLSFGATQTVPVGIGKLSLHADYSYRAPVVYTWETPAANRPDIVAWNIQNQLGVIPGYGLVNARAALTLDQPHVEVAIWGRNLGNKEYYVQQFDSYAGLGTSENFQGDPRTYGVTFTYHFK
jgi:iron complex outermembrane recepter protein